MLEARSWVLPLLCRVVFSARRFSQKISFSLQKPRSFCPKPTSLSQSLRNEDTWTEIRTNDRRELYTKAPKYTRNLTKKFDQIFCRCHYTTVANSFLTAGRQCHYQDQRGCTALRYSYFQLTTLIVCNLAFIIYRFRETIKKTTNQTKF